MTRARWIGLLFGIAPAACVGGIDSSAPAQMTPAAGGSGGVATLPLPPDALRTARTPLRRLSKTEVRATILDLVGIDPASFSDFKTAWPDELPPFDTYQQVDNSPFVGAVMSMADGIARAVAANDTRRRAVVGCAPANAGDTACLRSFISGFGRRALRRPLEADEIAELQNIAGASGPDLPVQVETVLRTILRDPEFLFLVECGGCTRSAGSTTAPAEGQAIPLGSFEMASRLSYLIWGSAPDNELLDAAEHGSLGSADGIARQARRLLAQDQPAARVRLARDRVNRFHAMWLGTAWSGSPLRLPQQMKAETDALIERVVFDNRRPWLDVFLSKETYVDATLAAHYNDGLRGPATGSAWVTYPAGTRQGILSHGTFLSLDNPADTSPTFRGRTIKTRLLCETMHKPDAATLAKLNGGKPVSTTPLPPLPGECKVDRYARSYLDPKGPCYGCHSQMDPIGFGLENYDRDGRYRSSQPAQAPLANGSKPPCKITSEGKISVNGETKTFKGPTELADLLTGTDQLRSRLVRCMTTNFFRFAAGRPDRPEDDGPFIENLASRFEKSAFDFQELIVSLVAAPAWHLRVPDGPGH